MSIRRRRWERKYPAPPPTPEGYVWATRWGRTELVKTEDLQKFCQKSIGHLDELPEPARLKAKETGEVPDLAEAKQKVEQNKRTVALGFGRAF